MKINKTLLVVISQIPILGANAQEASDSIQMHSLDEIVVESRNKQLGKEVSTYLPTHRHKNSSQTAVELLNRMAIPQLRISPNEEVKTLAGKNVDLFVDFLPASKEDLEGMRMQDVKKVEYYDFPSDPRFQGKTHVINFVMQKYEYGGYLKAYGWETTTNAGQFSLYGKLQYKRMTFDIAGGTSYVNTKHTGCDSYETFRLPQSDGSMKSFERISIQEQGKLHNRTFWPTVKAVYSSDNILIQNVIGADFYHSPFNNESGHVSYVPEISSRINYSNQSSDRVNSLVYNGYWNFVVNENNSIIFSPVYAYSHTNTGSIYSEGNTDEYYNAAKDDSHQFKADLTYAHSFGKFGNLNAMFQTIITTNNTSYSGTANSHDDAHTYRVGPGVQYSVTLGNFYGLVGFGYHWDRQEYMDHKENSSAPWVDFSIQYSPNDHHILSGEFHHMKSIPSSNFRSAVVIRSNPLMSYTGNPNLRSYGSYDAGVNYSFTPNNILSFSAFATAWIVDNRYVYDYRPDATGIIRTINQPGGAYSQWDYGVYASLLLFNRQLQLSGQLNATSVHNGEPYNLNKTHIGYSLQADYYLNDWTFSGLYYGPQGSPEGCMVGTWKREKSFYMVQVGWSNSMWNVQLQFSNFARWNWNSEESVMRSKYYDKVEKTLSINDHAFARLSLTYTFGFGKRIERVDEASQQNRIDSGILK